jgi:hypothetical protein
MIASFTRMVRSITLKSGEEIPVQRNQSGLFIVPRAALFGYVKTEDTSVHAFPSQVTVNGTPLYTDEQVRRAQEVRTLHNVLNHPNDGKQIGYLQYGIIVGTHLTARDVRVHRDIYGPCVVCRAGGATKSSFEELVKSYTLISKIY